MTLVALNGWAASQRSRGKQVEASAQGSSSWEGRLSYNLILTGKICNKDRSEWKNTDRQANVKEYEIFEENEQVRIETMIKLKINTTIRQRARLRRTTLVAITKLHSSLRERLRGGSEHKCIGALVNNKANNKTNKQHKMF